MNVRAINRELFETPKCQIAIVKNKPRTRQFLVECIHNCKWRNRSVLRSHDTILTRLRDVEAENDVEVDEDEEKDEEDHAGRGGQGVKTFEMNGGVYKLNIDGLYCKRCSADVVAKRQNCGDYRGYLSRRFEGCMVDEEEFPEKYSHTSEAASCSCKTGFESYWLGCAFCSR